MLTVNDAHGAGPQTLETYIATVGSSEGRCDVWAAIYRGRSKTKTVSELAAELGITRKAVLKHGLYLADHHVVTQEKAVPPGGSVRETAYSKTSFGKANRDKILREAVKPKSGRKAPAAAPPTANGGVTRRAGTARGRSKLTPQKRGIKLLFATATPASQHPLRLDAEARLVAEHVRRSNFRDRLEIISSPAVDADSLMQGLNDHRPAIVHFSGHGSKGSLWLDDGKITKSVGKGLSFNTFAKVIAATDTPPKLVVLNSCHSASGSAALLAADVEAVIGMSDSISDPAAAIFSSKLYAAIASDQSLSAAFAQACVALEASGLIKDSMIPTLEVRAGFDATKMRLLR
jgi:hypothetical protein